MGKDKWRGCREKGQKNRPDEMRYLFYDLHIRHRIKFTKN